MSLPDFTASPPDIRLFGKVDESMLASFLQQQSAVRWNTTVTLELSTSGGNADVGRRIALELADWQRSTPVRIDFLGKSYVYSAGVTVMSAIPAARRFLSADCELLIHERKMQKVLHLEGALRGCRTLVQDALAEIDSGQRLERAGFTTLVEGTRLSVDDVMARVLERDWYLTADEALQWGLVGGVV